MSDIIYTENLRIQLLIVKNVPNINLVCVIKYYCFIPVSILHHITIKGDYVTSNLHHITIKGHYVTSNFDVWWKHEKLTLGRKKYEHLFNICTLERLEHLNVLITWTTWTHERLEYINDVSTWTLKYLFKHLKHEIFFDTNMQNNLSGFTRII